MQIEIISVVGPQVVKKNGKTYQTLEVAYKKDGKIEGKKLVDFNNKGVFELASQAKQGEVYNVSLEKNDAGFWQWIDFKRAGAEDAPASQESDGKVSSISKQDAPQSSGRPAGRVTGSNYETPEERAIRRGFEALKHRQIGRQGCLNIATSLLIHNAPEKLVSEEAVIALAKKYEQFVFGDKTAEEAVAAVKGMIDDIPF